MRLPHLLWRRARGGGGLVLLQLSVARKGDHNMTPSKQSPGGTIKSRSVGWPNGGTVERGRGGWVGSVCVCLCM